MVVDQTIEWSDLVKRHFEEEHQLRKSQLREEWDLIPRLLEEAHKLQMQGLKQKLEMSVFCFCH